MAQKATVRRLMDSEVREERELYLEYGYLRKLEESISERNKTAAIKAVYRIHRYERRLERVHHQVLANLLELRRKGIPPHGIQRIEEIERDIEYFMNDFSTVTDMEESMLEEMIRKDAWDDLERYVIGNLERDIRRWLEIDKALIDLELDMMVDGNMPL